MTGDPVAFHEAGHVVIGYLSGMQVIDADLLADDDGGNAHTHFVDPGVKPPTRDFVERLLTTFMAGFAAESRAGHIDPDGSGYDRDEAVRRWASYLAPPGPEQDAALGRALEQASELLDRPAVWAAVEAVARALSERGRLDGATAQDIVRRFGLAGGEAVAS